MRAILTYAGLTLIALAASTSMALAQAGSAGGTIGKQGKSVSGSEDAKPAAPTPKRAQPNRPSRRASPDAGVAQAGVSVSGRWRWQANCVVARYAGQFVLSQSGGQFSGSFGNTSAIDGGRIVGGRINGSELSFTRTSFKGERTQRWTATLSPSTGTARNMQGSHTAKMGACQFQASRD
jgi:hypothetical protein